MTDDDQIFDELEPSAADEPVLDDVLGAPAPETPETPGAPDARTGFGALSPTPEEVASFQEFANRVGDVTKSALTLPPSFVQSVKDLTAKVTPGKKDGAATTLPRSDGDPGTFVVRLPADVLAVLGPLAEQRRISMERLLQSIAEDEAYRVAPTA